MTQATYYTRYPRRPSIQQKRCNVASLILGALALVTSWLAIGIGFGVAAVAAGVVARAQAKPGARKPSTAGVGIALGLASIIVGLGIQQHAGRC
jgi:hypothetical protein